jgi:hypothetical protein
MNNKDLMLHKIAAKYIINEDVDVELNGSYAELLCLKELLDVSKELKESLENDVSLDNILKILEIKKSKTSKFESLTGVIWRL